MLSMSRSTELAEPLLEERPDLVLALVRDLLDGGAARA
jgi:hypothetical protein